MESTKPVNCLFVCILKFDIQNICGTLKVCVGGRGDVLVSLGNLFSDFNSAVCLFRSKIAVQIKGKLRNKLFRIL